jgi:thioredoxin 1
MATVDITKENFEPILNQGGLLLIDCWAQWCGPCRAFGPIYDRVAARHPEITFGKVDTEGQRELAALFRVHAIPTLLIFRDGILVFSQSGLLPEKAIESVIAQAQALDMVEVRRQVQQGQAAE